MLYKNKNKNIEDVIKKINKMSDKTLKEELLKDGIEIKSNKKGLLKDMYMFCHRWVVLKYTKNNLIIIFYLTCFHPCDPSFGG